MTLEQALTKMNELQTAQHAYGHAMGVLSLDGATAAPRRSVGGRGKTMGVLSGITLVFLPAVSSFFIPKLLGGGQYVLVGNIIETQFLPAGDWNFGSAISLIMTIIVMLSLFFTKKLDRTGSSEGGK